MSGQDTTIVRLRRKRFGVVMAVVVAVDLASKAVAVATLDTPIDLGFVRLWISHNSGVAFGVGDQLPVGIVLGFTVVITVWLVVAALRGHFGSGPGPALVAGGATANVIDRIHNGSVVDIIDLGWWPAFNLADTAICVGVGLVIFQQILHNRENDVEPPARRRRATAEREHREQLT